MDTLLFVDDTPFELEEVKRSCPEVRTLDARLYQGLASMPELDVPVTQESRSRRAMYQLETERQKIAEGFGNDYMAFLKHCQIELSIQSLSEDNLDRVHELTQRTNQMNFSGNRYDRDKLRTILNTPHLDTYVVSCRDRFGNYGIIGFGIVDKQIPRITDLMFSCRVQSKRVEHAVLSYILRKYVAESGKDVYTSYRKTPRNEPSGRVFADFGMAEVGIYDGVSDMSFHQDQPVPDDYVIRLIHEDTLAAV
jgi:FkbH-like protein